MTELAAPPARDLAGPGPGAPSSRRAPRWALGLVVPLGVILVWELGARLGKRRWLDPDSKVTLQELADEYGVSAERIRQVEANALKKMKALFAA